MGEPDFMHNADKSPRLYITKKMDYRTGHDWMDNMTSHENIFYGKKDEVKVEDVKKDKVEVEDSKKDKVEVEDSKKDEVEVEEEGGEDYVQRRLAAAKSPKKRKEGYFQIQTDWMDDMTIEDGIYHRNFSASPKRVRPVGEEATVTRNLEGTAGAGVVSDSDVEGMLFTRRDVKSLMMHKMFVAACNTFAGDVGIVSKEQVSNDA